MLAGSLRPALIGPRNGKSKSKNGMSWETPVTPVWLGAGNRCAHHCVLLFDAWKPPEEPRAPGSSVRWAGSEPALQLGRPAAPDLGSQMGQDGSQTSLTQAPVTSGIHSCHLLSGISGTLSTWPGGAWKADARGLKRPRGGHEEPTKFCAESACGTPWPCLLWGPLNVSGEAKSRPHCASDPRVPPRTAPAAFRVISNEAEFHPIFLFRSFCCLEGRAQTPRWPAGVAAPTPTLPVLGAPRPQQTHTRLLTLCIPLRPALSVCNAPPAGPVGQSPLQPSSLGPQPHSPGACVPR